MEIRTDFCGGNARVLSIDGDRVRLEPELRDTTEPWFYWAFRVVGAGGRTLTFDFAPNCWIGYFGAAVSHDLHDWRWSDTASEHRTAFTYTFADGEDDVYFAHDMLYHPSRFYKFAEMRGLKLEAALDRNNVPIPIATVGEGSRVVLLTARHHACESTGDYVMEGIIDAYRENPLEDTKIIAIPFVDAAGVVAGDQGKSRAPHDHNRDYGTFLYPGTRLVKSYLDAGNVRALFDLHSPWHIGGRNDKMFVVRKDTQSMDSFLRFSKCLEQTSVPDSMSYSAINDINPGEEWNNNSLRTASTTFSSSYPSIELSFSFESTYFGDHSNKVSPSRLIAFGHRLWLAYLSFLL